MGLNRSTSTGKLSCEEVPLKQGQNLLPFASLQGRPRFCRFKVGAAVWGLVSLDFSVDIIQNCHEYTYTHIYIYVYMPPKKFEPSFTT